jgi:hypothetical protein
MSHNPFQLRNVNWEQYDIDTIRYKNITVDNKETTKKAIQDNTLSHIDIYYFKNPFLYVTTPTMVSPFKFNRDTHLLYLQFTNLKTDTVMESFYDFITMLELNQMKWMGIEEDTADSYLSQIKQDKQEKYDPNLVTKVPFRSNRYEVDIFNSDKQLVSIYNIPRFAKLQCDIYIDKIWKYNGKFVCKWKIKKIHLL